MTVSSLYKNPYRDRGSHYKDKMVSPQSQLYNGNPYTWKDVLYIEMGPEGHDTWFLIQLYRISCRSTLADPMPHIFVINTLVPVRCDSNSKKCNFHDILKNFLWNCSGVDTENPHWLQADISAGNGLVPSGNKPLTEPMLTQIYVSIWHH